MTDHPAVAYLLAAHERAVALAEEANRLDLQMHPPHPVEFILSAGDLSTKSIRAGERFIEANMPDMVLLRVTAERELLADLQAERHLVVDGDCWYTCAAATEEHDGGESCRDLPEGSPCDCGRDKRVGRRVAMLAKAWGWKEPT